MKTTLMELGLCDSSDWIEQVGEDVYREMLAVYRSKQDVEVLCKAVDSDTPESSYYDVKLPSGATVDALQGFHLKGIHNYVEQPPEPFPLGVGVMYMVEIYYPDFREGMELNHTEIEIMVKEAVEQKIKERKKHMYWPNSTVTSVAFETDYPIPHPEDL